MSVGWGGVTPETKETVHHAQKQWLSFPEKGEEAAIESTKSQPIYTRGREQAGLLATEPGEGRNPSEVGEKNVLDVWEERERSDR